MTIGRFLWIAGAAIVVMILNVAIFYLWVWIYATFIDKGQDNKYYEDYAQRNAPYSSMIVGLPLMIGAAWVLGTRWEPDFALTAALTLWIVYTVVDLAIVAASKPERRLWVLAGISQAIKLIGALIGVSLV